MVSEGHFAAEDINVRIMGLQQHWQSLKDKAAQRKLDLEDSLQAQQYFAGKMLGFFFSKTEFRCSLFSCSHVLSKV